MSDNEKPDYGIVAVETPPKQGILGWLRARFVAGMLIALPIVATFVILQFLINFIDSRVVPLLPPSLRPETYLDYAVPGFGLLILLVFLTFVGAIATNFLGKFLVNLTDRVLTRVPVVRSVYSVFKQIRDVFQNNTAGQYKEVAMVEYPRAGSWVIGFVAGPVKGELRQRLGEDYIGIFVPTTPNPTSGFLLYVAEEKVMRLNMTVEEGAKIIFSGGLVVPDFPQAAPESMPVGK
ncbi:DUF502 domain-containing protein [Hyphomonas sp. WL0036]|uniref:DUF502 domain-containing protein n=1 Tax=Hyphomonas sediminis TaxID=2866160 RepID=UPI001C81CFEE|nr:DUF502 domain-containing protein [Hyphomonas sediminis]MBY9067810.1 DUF502 domain-containing protein [Hyphomonas sediminis]